MTFWDDSFRKPKVRSSSFSELRSRFFQKRYLWATILLGLVPFLVLRLVLFYDVTVLFKSPDPDRIPVDVASEEILKHTYVASTQTDGKLPITHESRGLLRPDEDAWISHDEWINHIKDPKDGSSYKSIPEDNEKRSGGQEVPLIDRQSGRAKEILENFGLPRGNEKDGQKEIHDAKGRETNEKKKKEDRKRINEQQRVEKKNLEAEQAAAEKKAKEERQVDEQKRAAKQREEEEKKIQEEKAAAKEKEAVEQKRKEEEQKRAAEQREEEEKRANEEKAAAEEREAILEKQRKEEEEKRAVEQRVVEQKKANEEKAATEEREAEEKRKEEELNRAAEQRQAEEKRAVEQRVVEQKKASEEKAAAEEREAEGKRKEEELNRAAEQRQAEEKKLNEEKAAAHEREDEGKRNEEELKRAAEQTDLEEKFLEGEAEEKRKSEGEQKIATEEREKESEKKVNEENVGAQEREADELKRNDDEQKRTDEQRGAEDKDAEEKNLTDESQHTDDQNQVEVDGKEQKYEASDPREDSTAHDAQILPVTITPPGQCDLFDGGWEYDPEGPLYNTSTCSFIGGDQDCIANGRPDTQYLYWKWKPRNCDLPRFDAGAFLEAFKGKSIGFVGDSLARNQMQSLLCMLSQVEEPNRLRDHDGVVIWLYPQHQVRLVVLWSPYLLKFEELGTLPGVDESQPIVHLDVLDPLWTSMLPELNIIVLSIGQWFFKTTVYKQQDEVVGCHYCPGLSALNLTDMGFIDMYRDTLRMVLEKVVSELKGIAIMSTFAIQHFEHGPWEDHGDCRREKPLEPEELALFPGMHGEMHGIVMGELHRMLDDKSRLNENVHLDFLDVTKVSLLRADGHPGPYRRPHPYQDRDPTEWVINDCLHWCLPGPVDTWNQLLVKIAHRYL